MAEQLPPGRALDAKVAEKVMEWTRSKPAGDLWQDVEGVTQHFAGGRERFAPSTDWRAAGEVVEKMRERGWWLDLRSPFELRRTRWRAGFTPHSCTGWNGVPDNQVFSDTAPHAICLAALAACEEAGK